MCLIIHAQPGAHIPLWLLKSMCQINKDGIGAVWTDAEGKVQVRRDVLATWRKQLGAVLAYTREADGAEMVIHGRMRTHGDVSIANCHPFRAHNGWLLFHNGIIGGLGDGVRSDTAQFVQCALTPILRQDPALSEQSQALLGSVIGGSKLVLVRPGGRFLRLPSMGWYPVCSGVEVSNKYAWRPPHWKKPVSLLTLKEKQNVLTSTDY